jgi:hypothetical protein
MDSLIKRFTIFLALCFSLTAQTTVTGSATIAADTFSQLVIFAVPPNATGATYTTDTATAFCGKFLGAVFPNTTPRIIIFINTGMGTITVAGGTGVTVKGTATIAINSAREFMVYPTSCVVGSEAVTLQSMGIFSSL